jgi:hypothetical protein
VKLEVPRWKETPEVGLKHHIFISSLIW